MTSCAAEHVTLPWSFIRIATNGGAGSRYKFRAAALDEVAGFGDDILQHSTSSRTPVSRSMISAVDGIKDGLLSICLAARMAPSVALALLGAGVITEEHELIRQIPGAHRRDNLVVLNRVEGAGGIDSFSPDDCDVFVPIRRLNPTLWHQPPSVDDCKQVALGAMVSLRC